MTEPDFLADLEDYVPRRTVCTVSAILESLDDQRAAKLRAYLGSPVSSSAIAASLRRAGITVGAGTIGRHRRGECRCSR